eukprot:751513-Ditylum_brightwellii.AAC.1
MMQITPSVSKRAVLLLALLANDSVQAKDAPNRIRNGDTLMRDIQMSHMNELASKVSSETDADAAHFWAHHFLQQMSTSMS